MSDLKSLAKSLGRTIGSLIALVDANDPWVASRPARRAAAEWFAQICSDLNLKRTHIRSIMYTLISLATPTLTHDGNPFENTLGCWQYLQGAARDARYLGLTPGLKLNDRRNAEPVINFHPTDDDPADIEVMLGEVISGGRLSYHGPRLELPDLRLVKPSIHQRYHLEVWCEKSTMNDILKPLACRYDANFVYGVGEMSTTRCEELVERARQSGLPVRILYISDFDPAGASMPVAAARKIEYFARNGTLDDCDLDIQLIPIALTHEQCVEYGLPRTPLKESERRANKFEERFGTGATELDALETLHPGELRRIVSGYLDRYYDSDLAGNVKEAVDEAEGDLDQIVSDVHEKYADEIAMLERDNEALTNEIRTDLAVIQQKINRQQADFVARAAPLLEKIKVDMENAAPDPDNYEWPEPAEGDEVDDPLFDSTRPYIEQIARYHQQQGKVTHTTKVRYPCQCIECGKNFKSPRSTTKFCSRKCNGKHSYSTKKTSHTKAA